MFLALNLLEVFAVMVFLIFGILGFEVNASSAMTAIMPTKRIAQKGIFLFVLFVFISDFWCINMTYYPIFLVSRLEMNISSSPDDCEKIGCILPSSGDDEMFFLRLETENIGLENAFKIS